VKLRRGVRASPNPLNVLFCFLYPIERRTLIRAILVINLMSRTLAISERTIRIELMTFQLGRLSFYRWTGRSIAHSSHSGSLFCSLFVHLAIARSKGDASAYPCRTLAGGEARNPDSARTFAPMSPRRTRRSPLTCVVLHVITFPPYLLDFAPELFVQL
jgi:hypothetical protein